MPWLNKVRSVLEVWYPGQQYGTALALAAVRRRQPLRQAAAHLPGQRPARARWAAEPTSSPATAPPSSYSEGNLVGYRWYDATGQQPLFPFGYGQSYTTFALQPPQGAHPGVPHNRHRQDHQHR